MSASWSSALRDCLGLLPPAQVEVVPRAHALGRLLRQEISPDRDYPIGDLSMMDGYAIGSEAREYYLVEGENRPGSGAGPALAPGSARRLFTGAELPPHAACVIPQELTKREEDRLHITQYPETSFIRRRGSEAKKGSIVLKPGLRLGAIELALLATIGVSDVHVARLPRLAHLVTGDEIALPEETSPGSRVRDSNSILVASVLGNAGYPLAAHRRVKDDKSATIQAIEELMQNSDVLLVSGGASVGDHDYARPALEAAGFRFVAHGVDLRPGKPVGLALRGQQWAIVLPGNPVSHLVTLHLFVLPMLLGLEGVPYAEPRLIRGRLQDVFAAEPPRRPTFWPSAVHLVEGAFHLQPKRFLSSGDLIGIAGANALLFLPVGQPVPQKGEDVLFLSLLPGFSTQ